MLDILFSTQAWALESKYFNIIKPVILSRLAQGQRIEDLFQADGKDDHQDRRKANTPSFVSNYQSALRINGQASGEINVQVIQLRGPMVKNGGWCSTGTAQIAAALKQAYKNPDVNAIVLQVDSPGGSVDGTEYLGSVIRQATKPVVAFVDGLAASAAYWAASQASHIMMSSKTTSWVGSIGTLIMHVDQSGWLAKEGIKVTYITADASVDKVKGNSFEPLTDDSIALFKKDLNTINDTFIETVKAGRGKKLTNKTDLFTGKLFNGSEAIGYGLADSTGTLEDAINQAAAMARKRQGGAQSSQSQSPTHANTLMKFPKVSALFGLNDASADAEVTEIQAAEAETALEAKETEIAALQAQLAEKDGQITARDEQIATLTAQVAGNEKTVADLNAQLTSKDTEIQTLENWRKEHAARDRRQEDASNDLNRQTAALSPNQARAQKHLEETKAIKARKGQA